VSTVRIAVTGVGVICALGRDQREYWRNAIEGRSGIGALRLFDVSGLVDRPVGQVQEDPRGARGATRTDLFCMRAWPIRSTSPSRWPTRRAATARSSSTRAIEDGRVGVAYCGGVELLTPELLRVIAALGAPRFLGEGCASFVMESAESARA